MARWWRWVVVMAGVAALMALPAAVGALPAGRAAGTAASLLARIKASRDLPYAGYAESAGGLVLPVTAQLTSVSDLLGGRTQLRVWWRSAQDWRVDTVGPTGEEGTHRTAGSEWTWDYETNVATVTTPVTATGVRLPAAADLLPSALGQRLLGEATPAEVSPLPTRRIAGRDADGLRLRPADPDTTIARVDVWADRVSGIPLRVDLFGADETVPAMTSSFTDFTTARPSAAQIDFRPPATAEVRVDPGLDLLDLVSRFEDATLPARLAGLPRNARIEGVGDVGVYGRGVTEVVALPLPWGQASSLQDQLEKVPGVARSDTGLRVAAGPLGLMLTTDKDQLRQWLLAGTVTPKALQEAAVELTRSTREALYDGAGEGQ